MKQWLYHDRSFPIWTALLGAGVLAGTQLFLTEGMGLFNDIGAGAVLLMSITEGQYAVAIAFGFAYLFSRLLEGSATGVLDIGGSVQTGIGIGIPALLVAVGLGDVLQSFPLSLLVGALAGTVLGGCALWLKNGGLRFFPSTFGADLLIGAGNASVRYLGPLLIVVACTESVYYGVFAILGAASFHYMKQTLALGALVGILLAALW
ncbi:MAG: DUF4310 family protein [Bacilli bacterium]